MIIYVLFQKVTLARTKPSGRDVSWLKSGSAARACILRPAALCLMSQLGLDPPVDPPPSEAPAQIQLTQVGYRPIQPHRLASLRFEIKGEVQVLPRPNGRSAKECQAHISPWGLVTLAVLYAIAYILPTNTLSHTSTHFPQQQEENLETHK